MALPPTIPTSFVPKQPVATGIRQKSGTNIFLIGALAVLGLSVIGSAATFGYEFYLKSARDAKAAELALAQQSVDIDVVESFIRLRDRLAPVDDILNEHVTLSEFFDTLEVRTLQNVRFNNMSITVANDRTAEIETEGVARTFNALAAQSAALAGEKRIKRAIFSGISVNDNGTVSFTLTASLDPRLITAGEVLPGIPDSAAPVQGVSEPVSPVQQTAPAATTTGTTTPRL